MCVIETRCSMPLIVYLFELMSAMIHVKKSNGRCNLTGGLGLPGMDEAYYHPSQPVYGHLHRYVSHKEKSKK